MIGSAEVGLSCFTCITGEAFPDDDDEIDEAVDRNRVHDGAQGARGDEAGEIPF